ncbi:MAG: hypothetical protein WBF66_03420 [Dehalococcoidia bacterium]
MVQADQMGQPMFCLAGNASDLLRPSACQALDELPAFFNVLKEAT